MSPIKKAVFNFCWLSDLYIRRDKRFFRDDAKLDRWDISPGFEAAGRVAPGEGGKG